MTDQTEIPTPTPAQAIPLRRTLRTVEQVAEHFGKSKSTIRRWVANGSLPAFRAGGTILIDLDAAEAAVLRPINATPAVSPAEAADLVPAVSRRAGGEA